MRKGRGCTEIIPEIDETEEKRGNTIRKYNGNAWKSKWKNNKVEEQQSRQ